MAIHGTDIHKILSNCTSSGKIKPANDQGYATPSRRCYPKGRRSTSCGRSLQGQNKSHKLAPNLSPKPRLGLKKSNIHHIWVIKETNLLRWYHTIQELPPKSSEDQPLVDVLCRGNNSQKMSLFPETLVRCQSLTQSTMCGQRN